MLRKLFDKYVAKVLEFRRKNCRELVPTSHLNAVSSLCYLLDALVTHENGVRTAWLHVIADIKYCKLRNVNARNS